MPARLGTPRCYRPVSALKPVRLIVPLAPPHRQTTHNGSRPMLSRSDNRLIPSATGFRAARAETRRVSLLRWARRVGEVEASPDAVRVLTTVAFTDIVDSTTCAARLGDRRWSELLRQHDAIVRRELADAGGREVKTTGDGFLVSFASPTSAVRWASAVARAIASLGVRVRAGIHTGECMRTNDDLIGITLYICARICALADPGEVLVSGTVRELTTGSELRFLDRGAQPLRGISEPWEVYSLLDHRADVVGIRSRRARGPAGSV
jgi:class 3 adenylate cyclase